MADVLSQSEVESLLSAFDPAAVAARSTAGRRNAADARAGQFDFNRPEGVGNDLVDALRARHESFARELAAALSGALRTKGDVTLIRAEGLPYGEFLSSLENPTCITLLFSKGLQGPMLVEMKREIVFAIVDRLLGGGEIQKQSMPNRPLTDIELKLVSRITGIVVRGIENAWHSICDLQLEVSSVESDPQLVQIVPPNQIVVAIAFEIALGEIRGTMNLCIPLDMVQPFSGKLPAQTASSQSLSQDAGSQLDTVNMVVELATTMLSNKDVMSLAVGDIIMTEHGANQSLQVLIDGRPLFDGFAGVLNGHKAIRINRRTGGGDEFPRRAIPQGPLSN